MKKLVIALLLLMASGTARAQERFVQRTTDVLCTLPTLAGVCLAIANEDKKGALELGLSTATALAANYALEGLVRKDRPDGTGHHAFPSTHTLLAFNGSSFVMRRYGWKWGVPAYALSAFVAWGRTYANKHDWWDVLGGAALGAGAAFIYTRPFIRKTDLTISPAVLDGGAKGLSARIEF